jgi:hypothetical protein
MPIFYGQNRKISERTKRVVPFKSEKDIKSAYILRNNKKYELPYIKLTYQNKTDPILVWSIEFQRFSADKNELIKGGYLLSNDFSRIKIKGNIVTFDTYTYKLGDNIPVFLVLKVSDKLKEFLKVKRS